MFEATAASFGPWQLHCFLLSAALAPTRHLRSAGSGQGPRQQPSPPPRPPAGLVPYADEDDDDSGDDDDRRPASHPDAASRRAAIDASTSAAPAHRKLPGGKLQRLEIFARDGDEEERNHRTAHFHGGVSSSGGPSMPMQHWLAEHSAGAARGDSPPAKRHAGAAGVHGNGGSGASGAAAPLVFSLSSKLPHSGSSSADADADANQPEPAAGAVHDAMGNGGNGSAGGVHSPGGGSPRAQGSAVGVAAAPPATADVLDMGPAPGAGSPSKGAVLGAPVPRSAAGGAAATSAQSGVKDAYSGPTLGPANVVPPERSTAPSSTPARAGGDHSRQVASEAGGDEHAADEQTVHGSEAALGNMASGGASERPSSHSAAPAAALMEEAIQRSNPRVSALADSSAQFGKAAELHTADENTTNANGQLAHAAKYAVPSSGHIVPSKRVAEQHGNDVAGDQTTQVAKAAKVDSEESAHTSSTPMED